ncbi:MAG: putative toxin-antitoxin system toxin component, PIN family [Candidatus Gracilibacteria bacterium]|jgi:putative PIN family toxin of toxin-antitoxin system
MKKVFLDANIFFSATLSETGGSRKIFSLAQCGMIELFSSTYALKEARTNIFKKLGGKYLPEFYSLVALLTEVDKTVISDSALNKFEKYIIKKDCPILIGAIGMEVDILITLDRKDFKSENMQKKVWPFKILTPKEFLQQEILK